ncbi:MAG: prolyl oligopeptidase family serine peptidase [Gracilimonas sp.]|uniref:alpha/beta hydrolase family protein n=1 Tax=Gracilimonas sp. TaxID=1974203 RepID=UPI0037520EC7|nr:prolyl oligopeptidase family serine peptidase [Gracilimonas sp.]
MKKQFFGVGIFALLLLISGSLQAQKKDLKPADYAQWQSITSTAFADDGNWFSYQISLVEGDGWLMLTNVDSGDEHKFMYGTNPEFSSDNKWFAFRIGVSEDEARKLEKQEKPIQYDMGLMNLSTAEADTFKMIQDFDFNETGSHLIMKKYKAEGVKTSGTDIIIRNLKSGSNQLVGNVSDYSFNDAGTHLAVVIDASEKLGNGVHLMNLSNNSTTVLNSDTASYRGLSWHDEVNALAFMKTKSDTVHKEETHVVYAYTDAANASTQKVFDHTKNDQLPDDHRVVDFAGLTWAEDGETVFFGIKKWEVKEDEPEDTSAISKLNKDLDPTNVEVWHWKDAEIQPQQEVRQTQNERDNYLSAWHLSSNRFVQLEDQQVEDIDLTGDHEHAIGYDPHPYEPAFREGWNDIYVINTNSGERTKILERHENASSSPGGNYLLYFRDADWWTYDIQSNTHTNITDGIDTRFENFKSISGRENFPPFGTGQWVDGDDWLLIYDEYDVYKVWADGSRYEKVTNGREDEIVYRQTRLDYEEDHLAQDQPIYFSKYGYYTKDRGYARLDSRNRLQELIYESRMISRLDKAESADEFVFMKESATESPNFYHAGNSFRNPKRITNTNPQQEDYHWADDELITFTNTRGYKLQGRLLYPANYEEGKEYPMITYIYEMRSQATHNYSIPTRTSPYNMRRYSSEGYFVFEPDINYVLRDPGVSAVESVVPAVRKVLETGMVDKDKIGLTGHSWGAYQTAFIITQTDMFNSAVAGAPLTNMVSMYNSVYWNSGTPDAQIFEVSQGRFPEPYWQDWDKFIENSPIFNMEDNTTPLLVEFGTDDGAVDFNQGVELYNTMRRMEKPYVMLVYEGENHGLRQKENQIDYANRAFQWHEHFLKGEEAPKWISSGVPYLERPEIKKKE